MKATRKGVRGHGKNKGLTHQLTPTFLTEASSPIAWAKFACARDFLVHLQPFRMMSNLSLGCLA
jgi:hypothetical protein